MTLTERERATLAVALRAWQNELSYHSAAELREYYPDLRGTRPLSIDEVEALLVRLARSGAGGLHQEGDEATVSSVSVSAGGGS